MRALTVQQPYAWAIFNGKPIENRTQAWSYRGPLAIHAGQRWSDRGGTSPLVLRACERAGLPPTFHSYGPPFVLPSDFTSGAIIGVVDLVDVHTATVACVSDGGSCHPWGEYAVELDGGGTRDVVHLVLENPRPLAEPIPCRGALGLWTPPDDVLARLEAAL